MIIKKINFKPFKFELKQKFSSSKNIINQREGIYVIAEDELGNNTVAEVSPLPGFSKETLEEAEKGLVLIIDKLLNKELTENNFSIENIYNELSLPNSVRFGIDQLILNLQIKRNPKFVQNNFNLVSKNKINVNSIVGVESKEVILNKVEKCFNEGFSTIKIKIGRKEFNEDLQIIESIQNIYSGKLKLRCDVNGVWTEGEAIQNINSLNNFNLEYIEEPCSGISSNLNLTEISKNPIAIDESVPSTVVLKKLIEDNCFKFIVVKPMIVGSIFEILKLIKLAEEKNVNLIFSSAFESEVGRSVLVLLSSLVRHNYAHGLAISELIKKDIYQNNFPIINGSINFVSDKYPIK